jgi:hypothetical protein
MNLEQFKTKLGDNLNKFRDTVIEYGNGNGAKDTLFGIEFEVVKNQRHDAQQIVVIKVGDAYFKLDGIYDSWNGTNFDYTNFQQVYPYQRTTTEYAPLKAS